MYGCVKTSLKRMNFKWFPNTIDSRYIVLHTEQQLQCYNFRQTLHSQTTPHISPSRASYGVSFMSSLKKYDRDISRAHCILEMRS